MRQVKRLTDKSRVGHVSLSGEGRWQEVEKGEENKNKLTDAELTEWGEALAEYRRLADEGDALDT